MTHSRAVVMKRKRVVTRASTAGELVEYHGDMITVLSWTKEAFEFISRAVNLNLPKLT